jgi:hypothetical protein
VVQCCVKNKKKIKRFYGLRAIQNHPRTSPKNITQIPFKMSIKQDVNIGEFNMCRLEKHDPVKVAEFWKKAIEKGIVLESEGGADGGYISVKYKGKVIGEEWYGTNPVPLWHTIAKLIKT